MPRILPDEDDRCAKNKTHTATIIYKGMKLCDECFEKVLEKEAREQKEIRTVRTTEKKEENEPEKGPWDGW